MSDIKLFTTDELLAELVHRSKAYAIAYEMPENGDGASVYFDVGMDDFYCSAGLLEGLKARVDLGLAREAVGAEEYMDEEDEEFA